MTKEQARKVSRAEIAKMSAAEREWASGAIADALTSAEEFRKTRNIFIFLGTETEPNTEEITGLCLALEKNVSVPRIGGEDMQAVIITPYTDFKRNRWNILEPVGGREADDVALAVIPLCAFDGLKRVGHGKGYYDRFLARHDCFKIGLAFDCQKVSDLHTEQFDVPLDMLITEKRIIRGGAETPNPYGENL